METRQTLIERVRDQQDDKSWEEFTHFYSAYIYGVIKRTGMVHHDIEDLRQQVLMKAWKGLPKMTYDREKAPFRAWLCTIIRNEINSYHRRKSNKMKALEYEIRDSDHGAVTESDIEKLAEQEWKSHVSKLAMKEVAKLFEERVFKVFELFAKGLKGDEVAKACDISINSVYVYKKRVQNAMIKEILRLDQELA